MANGWTLERRKRQSEAIRQWKPWEEATGSASPEGKAVASRNAWTGGHSLRMRQFVKEMNLALRNQLELLK